MIQELEDIFLSRWEDLKLNGEQKPGRLKFFLTAKQHKGGKAFIFAVPEGETTPRLIVKVVREEYKTKIADMENAYRNLNILHQDKRLDILAKSVPRAVLFQKIDGYYVLAETYKQGAQIYKMLVRKEKVEYIESAFNWIVSFHKITKKCIRLDMVDIERLFLNRINRFKEDVAKDNHLISEYMDRHMGKIKEIIGIEMPLVFAHNDFAPQNLLYDRKKNDGDCCLSIVDWEHSDTCNLPLIDIVHLFTYDTWMRHRNALSDSFMSCLNADIRKRTEVSKFVELYAKKIGLDNRLIELILLQYLIGYFYRTDVNKGEIIKSLNLLSSGKVKLLT